jgi:hypothetical protein
MDDEELYSIEEGFDAGEWNNGMAREKELTEALVAVSKSLKAAISLLESTPQSKKAAASDKMFDQMIADYKLALERGVAALSLPNGER